MFARWLNGTGFIGKLPGEQKSPGREVKDAWRESRGSSAENREKEKVNFPLVSLFISRHYLPIYLSLFPRLLSERTCAERWEIARFNNAACLFRENNCSHRSPPPSPLPSLSHSSFSTIIFLFFFLFRLAASFSISTASDRSARETPVRSAFIHDFAFARITRDSGLRFSIGNDPREDKKKKKSGIATHSRLAAL